MQLVCPAHPPSSASSASLALSWNAATPAAERASVAPGASAGSTATPCSTASSSAATAGSSLSHVPLGPRARGSAAGQRAARRWPAALGVQLRQYVSQCASACVQPCTRSAPPEDAVAQALQAARARATLLRAAGLGACDEVALPVRMPSGYTQADSSQALFRLLPLGHTLGALPPRRLAGIASSAHAPLLLCLPEVVQQRLSSLDALALRSGHSTALGVIYDPGNDAVLGLAREHRGATAFQHGLVCSVDERASRFRNLMQCHNHAPAFVAPGVPLRVGFSDMDIATGLYRDDAPAQQRSMVAILVSDQASGEQALLLRTPASRAASSSDVMALAQDVWRTMARYGLGHAHAACAPIAGIHDHAAERLALFTGCLAAELDLAYYRGHGGRLRLLAQEPMAEFLAHMRRNVARLPPDLAAANERRTQAALARAFGLDQAQAQEQQAAQNQVFLGTMARVSPVVTLAQRREGLVQRVGPRLTPAADPVRRSGEVALPDLRYTASPWSAPLEIRLDHALSFYLDQLARKVRDQPFCSQLYTHPDGSVQAFFESSTNARGTLRMPCDSVLNDQGVALRALGVLLANPATAQRGAAPSAAWDHLAELAQVAFMRSGLPAFFGVAGEAAPARTFVLVDHGAQQRSLLLRTLHSARSGAQQAPQLPDVEQVFRMQYRRALRTHGALGLDVVQQECTRRSAHALAYVVYERAPDGVYRKVAPARAAVPLHAAAAADPLAGAHAPVAVPVPKPAAHASAAPPADTPQGAPGARVQPSARYDSALHAYAYADWLSLARLYQHGRASAGSLRVGIFADGSCVLIQPFEPVSLDRYRARQVYQAEFYDAENAHLGGRLFAGTVRAAHFPLRQSDVRDYADFALQPRGFDWQRWDGAPDSLPRSVLRGNVSDRVRLELLRER